MKVKITFYGQAADAVNSNAIELDINEQSTLLVLKNTLEIKHPRLTTIELKLAVNNKMVIKDFNLNDGDEISVLPPFSGG